MESVEKTDFKQISKKLDEIAPELKTLALNIHDNPELGLQEEKACSWQTELLEKYGFEISKNFCEITTAYKAEYRSEKQGLKIAMLAEYDALPNLGHACGHNLIAMMSVGSGILIKDLVEKYGGEIHVIGTPAEETEGAKVKMAEAGAFSDYDVVMMAHPNNENGSSMDTLAIRARMFKFFGKAAHAAGSPHKGINALDAMINFYCLINALRQQTEPDIRIHGIITNGGEAPNVIPDYTEAVFYVRANSMAEVDEVLNRVVHCAEGAALGTGCRFEVCEYQVDFKDTRSNMYLSELACRQMESLGFEVKRYGKNKIPGSSDLGDVSYQCPSIQLLCGMGEYKGSFEYTQHTEEFAEMAGTEQAMENCLGFVKGFAMTAQKLLTEPEHIKAIREEYCKEFNCIDKE